MVLANIAYILATEPSYGQKPVLMIDWDLEAPGLHRFFYSRFRNHFRQPENYSQALDEAPGLIDFLTDVAQFYQVNSSEKSPERLAGNDSAKALFRNAIGKHPLNKYLLQVDGNFHLSIMKAGAQYSEPGDSPSYMEKVQRFDWGAFHRDYGSFFAHFRAYLMQEYAYVLVDSRTGLTDTSGICTRVMPEKLVAVFVPNQQNLEGIQRVLRQAVEYRLDSRDARPLEIFPLASRIDGSDSTRRRIWWRGGEIDGEHIKGYQATFEDLFKQIYGIDKCDLRDYFDTTQIPHDGVYAYGEKIAAAKDGTDDKLSIGHACAQLTGFLAGCLAPWELPVRSSQEFNDVPEFRSLYDHIVSRTQDWEKSGRRWYKLLNPQKLRELSYAKSVEKELEGNVATARFLTKSRTFQNLRKYLGFMLIGVSTVPILVQVIALFAKSWFRSSDFGSAIYRLVPLVQGSVLWLIIPLAGMGLVLISPIFDQTFRLLQLYIDENRAPKR